ncbi:hypothetical protein FHY04_004248, partial [Sphingomonas sp. BK481]|nr:hypothetical protein [Sphingomonas sp. BK481]
MTTNQNLAAKNGDANTHDGSSKDDPLERFLISLHRNQRLQNSSSIPGVSRGPRCGR